MSYTRALTPSKHPSIEQLLTLRDEGRLRLHLLSMEARERWDELEAEIVALEERANREGERAAAALLETAKRLTRTLNELMSRYVSRASGLLTSVSALMTTSVQTCRPNQSLAHAAQLMWDADCGVIPVVDDQRVVAVITDRDVCMATFTQGKAPESLRVELAMSKQLFGCAANDSIGTVLTLMGEHRVRRLPVMNAELGLQGIISLADIARWSQPFGNATVEAAIADTLAAISERARDLQQVAAQ